MRQRWEKLTFLHWSYDPRIVEPLIPAPLTLDVFDGAAWIGLVPFLIAGLRPPFLPALPWISRFPETNVRTYVRGPDGARGVWFFTLDADRLLAVLAARKVYHLPYNWAAMQVVNSSTGVRYLSTRKASFGYGHTDMLIRPGAPISLGKIENFLTARFRLYSAKCNRVYTVPIEHAPWPLQSATVMKLENSLVRSCNLPDPTGEPLVHYSDDLAVKIGRLERVR
jgi:uncharacterized protein YqjF (DUF2071 family)